MACSLLVRVSMGNGLVLQLGTSTAHCRNSRFTYQRVRLVYGVITRITLSPTGQTGNPAGSATARRLRRVVVCVNHVAAPRSVFTALGNHSGDPASARARHVKRHSWHSTLAQLARMRRHRRFSIRHDTIFSISTERGIQVRSPESTGGYPAHAINPIGGGKDVGETSLTNNYSGPSNLV